MAGVVDKVRDAVTKHRKALEAMRNNGSAELARTITAIEQEVLRTIEAALAGPPLDAARIGNLVATLDELIAQSLIEDFGQSSRMVRQLMERAEALRVTTTELAFGASAFKQIGPAQILDVFENFERGRTHRALFRHFAGKWQRELGTQWDATVQRIRDRFTVGTAMGRPNNELAGVVRDDLGKIFETGQQPLDAWARGFVRTKFTEISNDTSVAMAREAGLENFVNIGVSDERQSDICAEASAQPPMTLEEWEASEWGLPPRHVLNCRCEMVAVPDRLLSEEWGKETGSGILEVSA